MKLNAVLCDFDGTLVDKQMNFNPGIEKLIARITAKNIHFSLATGQPGHGIIQDILQRLNISDYHIFHGGSMISHNKSKKILWQQPISLPSLKIIISYFKKNKLHFCLETKNNSYSVTAVETPNYLTKNHFKPISELTEYSGVLKILLTTLDNRSTENQVELIKKNLSKTCKDVSFTKFKWIYYGLDITSEKATKHTAVLEYEKLLKIPRNEIVAIGDDHNDYPMFTACGYKIAMDNAPDELKKIADFIAPAVTNNGTVVALQHIITKFKL